MRVRDARRPVRRGLIAGLAGLTAVASLMSLADPAGARDKSEPLSDKVAHIEVSSRTVDSFRRGPGDSKRYGRLEFRGGLTMTSPDARFGGFSGLIVSPDGRRLMAVSDEGYWLSASIKYAGRAPSGIDNARMGPLLALNGRPLRRKRS